jgi:CheY-like chemotaxis protein
MTDSAPNILLVEDDENDQVFVRRALTRAGITAVVTVNNGEEAIAYLRRSLEAQEGSPALPTLIVTDVKMPKMDGIDLLAWLQQQEELSLIAAVVLSSSSNHTDIKAAFKHGAKGYLIKPVQFGELEKVTRTILDYWRASCVPLVRKKPLAP